MAGGIRINSPGPQLRRTNSAPAGKGKEPVKLSAQEEAKLAKKKAKNEAEVKAQVKAQAADKKQAKEAGAGPSKTAETPESPTSSKNFSRSSSLDSPRSSGARTPNDKKIARWLGGFDKPSKNKAPVSPRHSEIHEETQGAALSRSNSQSEPAPRLQSERLELPETPKKSNLGKNIAKIGGGMVVGGVLGAVIAPFAVEPNRGGEPNPDFY